MKKAIAVLAGLCMLAVPVLILRKKLNEKNNGRPGRSIHVDLAIFRL